MRYVALLRGINVGGNNKVEMPRLSSVFAGLGYKNVATYINSGNVVFETDQKHNSLTSIIEKAIFNEFGLNINVIVKTIKSLHQIVERMPSDWQNNPEQKTDILFLWDKINHTQIINEIKHDPKVDDLLYIDGVIIWHIQRKDYKKSGMNDFIKNKYYKNVTIRNCNTVRKLAGM